MGLKRERGIRRSSGIDSVSLAGPGLRVQVLPGGRRILTADLPRRRATSAAEAGALTLTKTAPPGWVRPGGQLGNPVWVTWGTAGGVVPAPSAFTAALFYLDGPGTVYVWAKIGLNQAQPLICTSLAFVFDTNPSAYPQAPFDETTGAPPAFLYVPLGYVVSGTGGAITEIKNTGSGSIVVATHLANVSTNALGQVLNFTRSLSWWRTPDAAVA